MKRARAILVMLAIAFVTNIAISYATDSASHIAKGLLPAPPQAPFPKGLLPAPPQAPFPKGLLPAPPQAPFPN
ncbi:MAG: hypothetical protein HYR76_03000 [Ignavibacteria bacterium]|nr:hypothetical protein [Ignavibacteria bacterium]